MLLLRRFVSRGTGPEFVEFMRRTYLSTDLFPSSHSLITNCYPLRPGGDAQIEIVICRQWNNMASSGTSSRLQSTDSGSRKRTMHAHHSTFHNIRGKNSGWPWEMAG